MKVWHTIQINPYEAQTFIEKQIKDYYEEPIRGKILNMDIGEELQDFYYTSHNTTKEYTIIRVQ